MGKISLPLLNNYTLFSANPMDDNNHRLFDPTVGHDHNYSAFLRYRINTERRPVYVSNQRHFFLKTTGITRCVDLRLDFSRCCGRRYQDYFHHSPRSNFANTWMVLISNSSGIEIFFEHVAST